MMAHLGRHRLGDRIGLTLLTLNGNRTSSIPSYVPVAVIQDTSGTVETIRMVAQDQEKMDGLFGYTLRLNSSYSPGHHTVHYKYRANGKDDIVTDMFEVVDGGDAVGNVNATHWWTRPESEYLISLRDDGTLVQGQNPYVVPPEVD